MVCMAEFKVKKEASRIAAAWRATEQRVQALPADRETGPYRISSSGALYIPISFPLPRGGARGTSPVTFVTNRRLL